MAQIKLARAERRRQAAQARARGAPEIARKGTRHIEGTCGGCYFWDTTDPNVKGVGQGICRESSPQLVLVPTLNGQALQALWPVTDHDATCGKHKPIE